ncbi:MAG: NAD(P)H-dependent oxidoreductase subunit E [Planctomycetia bacterium]
MTHHAHPQPALPGPSPETTAKVVAEALAQHAGQPGALLPVFHAIQDRLGFVPPEAIGPIALALNQSRADVYGTLTFYHDFRTAPRGRHMVKMCRAEACQAVGSDALIEQVERRYGVKLGETRADGALTLEAVYCLGNCALGPSAQVDGRLCIRVTGERLAAQLPDVAPKPASGA